MKRMPVVLAAVACAASLAAKDVTALVDVRAAPRPFYTDRFMRVGYVADPVVGGEDAALRCRRAGAWTFRTSKCDDATLGFCARYGLRIVLVLDGDRAGMIAALSRIAKGPHASVLGGVQLGSDPTGGPDAEKWRAVAGAARRLLPKVPISLPVLDEKSEIIGKMGGAMGNVTHLIADLTDAPAPYARIDGISRALRAASDKRLRALRIWAVAPGGWKGLKGAKELAWQMHWIFSAFAVERTDGVFFARRYEEDGFGRMMRHFWATVVVQPHLIGHGEGTFAEKDGAKRAKAAAVDADDMGVDALDSPGLDDLEAAFGAGSPPKACANVADGRTGDLEYLVFAERLGDADESCQMCLAVVNTSGEPVELSIKPRSKHGRVGDGYWRQLKPDPETGVPVSRTFPRSQRKPDRFIETIAPDEVSFLDFRIK